MKIQTLFALAIVSVTFSLHAHTPGLSTLKLEHYGEETRVELIFSPADLQTVLSLDKNSDGIISAAEISEAQSALEKVANDLLLVSMDGRKLALAQTKCSADDNANFHLELRFSPASGELFKVVSRSVNLLPSGHRQFVSFQEVAGGEVTEDLLDAANNVFVIHLNAGNHRAKTVPEKKQTFGQFFVLGVGHILTGYDHLLFLFALLIVCDGFGSIAKIVTCFTLAHSLTLALATLKIVEIDGRIVEPMIAASIVYVGLENIFRHGHTKGRWLLTFAFGLVHGFGFASVLREMEIAKSGNVAGPLISFNLGAETGQIAVAAILLPLIWWLKRKPSFAPRWVPACSAFVAAAGAFWFVQRVWF